MSQLPSFPYRFTKQSTTNLVQSTQSKVVHLNPDWPLPVVLALSELRMRCRQATKAVGRPEIVRIAHQIEDGAKVGRVGWEQGVQEGEEGEVTFVTNMV